MMTEIRKAFSATFSRVRKATKIVVLGRELLRFVEMAQGRSRLAILAQHLPDSFERPYRAACIAHRTKKRMGSQMLVVRG
jgi:hypothetical protein